MYRIIKIQPKAMFTLLKRHRRHLFLQLRASFQVEKKFNFSEKNALRQAPFWLLTNDKRVASRFHNNKNIKKKIAGKEIVLVSEPLTSKAGISAAHRTRLPLQLLALGCNLKTLPAFYFTKKALLSTFSSHKRRRVWTRPNWCLKWSSLSCAKEISLFSTKGSSYDM